MSICEHYHAPMKFISPPSLSSLPPLSSPLLPLPLCLTHLSLSPISHCYLHMVPLSITIFLFTISLAILLSSLSSSNLSLYSSVYVRFTVFASVLLRGCAETSHPSKRRNLLVHSSYLRSILLLSLTLSLTHFLSRDRSLLSLLFPSPSLYSILSMLYSSLFYFFSVLFFLYSISLLSFYISILFLFSYLYSLSSLSPRSYLV